MMIDPYRFASAGSAAWNPADKSAGLTLSNSNRTATSPLVSERLGVRGGMPRSTGKRYFELTISSNGVAFAQIVGIAPIGWLFPSTIGEGAAINGWGVNSQGTIRHAGASFGVTPSRPDGAGVVTMIAVDFDTGGLWIGTNGAWASGDPSTGTSPSLTSVTGTVYPAATINANTTASYTVTLRDQAVDQTYSLPTGFAAWTS